MTSREQGAGGMKTFRTVAYWTIKVIEFPFLIIVIVLDQLAELTGA
jgi:hypothetical protein